MDALKYDYNLLRESVPLRFALRDRGVSDSDSPLAAVFAQKLAQARP